MTESTPLAKAAAEFLVTASKGPPEPSVETTRLEIDALRAELARTRRRAMLRNRAIVLASAAAILIAIIAVRRSMVRQPFPVASAPITRVQTAHGSVTIERGSALVNAAAAQQGDVVACKGADCRAELVLPSGSLAAIHGDTRVALSSTSEVQLLGLDAGSARFDVVKLRPGERFIVKTIDAEIEVRGTSFRVTVAEQEPCKGAGRTRVEVFEGTVVVRHAANDNVLTAGQQWPVAPCALPPSTTSSTSTTAASAPTPAPALAPKAPATSSSDLSAHNALWAEAVAAKKRGDNSAALAGFTKYLAKYPNGFLAEAAEVERMRLLTGPARVDAARAYLAKHPNGYARAEAQMFIERAAQ